MSFTPRTRPQILTDMVNFVKYNTDITDFTVGSVVRTILEAAAIEDDEQYFQMVQLLKAFSINTARNSKLDLRVADFGIVRRSPTSATVPVRFYDDTLVQDQLAQDELSGATSIIVFDSTAFPTSGFPYTLRIGENLPGVQDIAVLSNDIAHNKFTLATPLTSDFSVGARVAVVPGTSAGRTFNVNTGIAAPATTSQAEKTYRTTEVAHIVAGNFLSNEVIAVANVAGTVGNVAASRVTKFTAGAPFQGAGVVNQRPGAGGLNRETDGELVDRALKQIQSLSRGTVRSLITGAIGVQDPITQSKSTSASLLEDFEGNEVRVYIDDGTGLIPDTVAHAESSTGGGELLPVPTLVLPVNDNSWPTTGWILYGFTDATLPSVVPQLVHYSSKTATSPYVLYLDTTVMLETFVDTYYVDVLTDAAETGQTRFSCHDFPIVRGAFKLYRKTGLSWSLLSLGTDYLLNRGTGEVQVIIPGGLTAGDILAAHYTRYSNLVQEVQKVLEGDRNDSANYPGVKAAGVFLSVEAPTIKRINVVASIAGSPGTFEDTLIPLVRRNMENYIKSLKIGQDVIVSKLVDVAFNVTGVADVHISSPATNVVVLENELPLPNDSVGNSLIIIS